MKAPGFQHGQVVERAPYDLLFGQRKAPDGHDNCYGVCPDNAIIKLADGQYEVDYDYRKGCGLCVAECPCGAIDMQPEPT